MSIPTQPTETTIIQKGYRLFGRKNPTSADITNAQDAIAQVKSDLMDEGREWAFLRRTVFTSMTINVNHIQAPTDYFKLIKAVIFDGTRRDTAQAGASTTVTLASADNGGDEDTVGKDIVITSGTGLGQLRQIKSYDSSTKVATVDEAWETNPDATSVYLIVDEQNQVHLHQIWNYGEIELTHLKDQPTKLYHFADDAEGDFYFNATPDKVYVIRLDYYADLRKEDTDTGTNVRYARILRLIEQVFVQGVFVWLLQNDARFGIEMQKYASMLQRAAAQFLYPNSVRQRAELAEDVY
jgi:hypothetical protein